MLRIIPASGVTDAAEALGFFVAPHPLSESYAEDIQATAVRPNTQANPPGTGLLADGSDRTSSSINGALAALGSNIDRLYTQLAKPVAQHSKILVDLAELDWTSRAVVDSDGYVEQFGFVST
jgi:hypothetical protein